MPHFCPDPKCQSDTYICQFCTRVFCGQDHPSMWIEGRGNACPQCTPQVGMEKITVEPTPKAEPVKIFLDTLTDRTISIPLSKCVSPPVGCGGPAEYFDNDVSRREYRISGLCQKCQDNFFRNNDE